jgi:sugar phosphate isomerase/epimerase
VSDLARLSLNGATVPSWSVAEAVDGCARAGVPWIGLWRDKVAQQGLLESARLARDAGVRVSSLCRGGFFPAPTAAERQARIDDNARALDEAAALGTDVLVLVCGGLPEGSRDLVGARQMVEDGVAALVPHAADRGVRLGIEPLHPMFAADRSVISTLGQANDIALRVGSPHVGVVIDVYHVWWDPTVEAEIERAAAHTVGFHVDDWIVPLPDLLRGRGMMGDGCIDLRRLRRAVDAAGYSGPIEVEIFNDTIWGMPGDDVLALVKQRYLAEVLS